MNTSDFFDHFDDHFSGLNDPRLERMKRHSLKDILLLTILGVICGADSWTDIELFGVSKKEELKGILSLPNGIPSHDTLGRVFSLLNPKQLEASFISWVKSLVHLSDGELVAVDGKTLRRSHNRSTETKAIHMVSAWAADNGAVLGQLKTEEKSNEITAIPQLLSMLQLKGCTVSIDAMGCQRAIAKQIREQEAHYLLALKGNQGSLHDDVTLFLETCLDNHFQTVAYDYAESTDKGHGRIERRQVWGTNDIDWLKKRHPHWPDLQSIGVIESSRQVGSERSSERRFFISSHHANAQQFLCSIRQHWEIENRLHWVLDVSFNEDQCRVRSGYAAENLSVIRHIAINLLRQESSKISIKAKRRKAGWDSGFLRKVLGAGGF